RTLPDADLFPSLEGVPFPPGVVVERDEVTDPRVHTAPAVLAAVSSPAENAAQCAGLADPVLHPAFAASLSAADAVAFFAGGVPHGGEWVAERSAQCHLARCAFGNPFRRVTLDASLTAWNDGLLSRLAQAAYEVRVLPEGTLDPARLA